MKELMLCVITTHPAPSLLNATDWSVVDLEWNPD